MHVSIIALTLEDILPNTELYAFCIFSGVRFLTVSSNPGSLTFSLIYSENSLPTNISFSFTSSVFTVVLFTS